MKRIRRKAMKHRASRPIKEMTKGTSRYGSGVRIRDRLRRRSRQPVRTYDADMITMASINNKTKIDEKGDEAYVYIEVKRDGKMIADIRVKVDTGAQGNTLPLRMFRKLYPEKNGQRRNTEYRSTGAEPYAITAR